MSKSTKVTSNAAPKSKANSIKIASPSPAVQTEVVPLPEFPISIETVGVILDSSDENFSMENVLEIVNTLVMPGMHVVSIDVPKMAEEEILVGSELGVRLKIAKEECLSGRKKDSGEFNWLTPLLFAELLSVRSCLDRDSEHRKEAKRREAALSAAKKDTEEASLALELAHKQFIATEKAVSQFSADQQNEENGAKLQGRGRNSVPKGSFKVKKARKILEESETKFKAAELQESSLQSSMLAPYRLALIYVYLGLGNKLDFLVALAAGSKDIFHAILSIVIRDMPLIQNIRTDLHHVSKDSLAADNSEVVTSLTSEFRKLAQASKLNEPVKKIAVIDILCEMPTQLGISGDGSMKIKGRKTSDKYDPQPVQPDEIAKKISLALQSLVSKLRDYKTLENNKIYHDVPTALPAKDVNLRQYRQLLSEVPCSLATVPVILHCMLEQVAMNLCSLLETKSIEKEAERMTAKKLIDESFSRLGHTAGSCPIKRPDSELTDEKLIIVNESDRVEKLAASMIKMGSQEWCQILSPMDIVQIEKDMLLLLPTPGVKRIKMPKVPKLSVEKRKAFETTIRQFTKHSISAISRFRKLQAFSIMCLQNNSGEEAKDDNSDIPMLEQEKDSSQWIDYRYVENFSNAIMAEVYTKAKVSFPFEKVFYDELEDCLLIYLFVTGGMHSWSTNIPYKVPFGEFCSISKERKLFERALNIYSIEGENNKVFEDRNFLLSQGGIICCGFPSTFSSRNEAQSTLYKDGNVFSLRTVKNDTVSKHELIISLNDGSIASFFLDKDGNINLQMMNPLGRLFELTSQGIVLLFPINMDNGTCNTQIDSVQIESYQGKDENELRAAKIVNESIDATGCFSSLLNKEKGEKELWRCILPSGAVIRYKVNGETQVLLKNGNVTEHKRDFSGTWSWLTTNNKGYTVIQVLTEEKAKEAKHDGFEEKDYIEKLCRGFDRDKAMHLKSDKTHERDMHIKENRKPIRCIHLPRDQLQSEGPYRPMGSSILYYFKCEEGLRALLKPGNANEDSLSETGGLHCQ